MIKTRFDANPLGWVWLRLVVPAAGLALGAAGAVGVGWPPSSRLVAIALAALVLAVAGYLTFCWFWAVELDENDLVLVSGTGRRQRVRYEELQVVELGGSAGSVRSGLMTVHTAQGRRTGVRVTGEDVLLAALAERAPSASLRGV